MSNELSICIWNTVNIISSIVGIASAVITIIAAFKTKKYAKRITQEYTAEALVIANEKIEQAKELFLELRKLKYGKARGTQSNKIIDKISDMEALLDEAENKTLPDIVQLHNSINDCKKTLSKCISEIDKTDNFLYLGTSLDATRALFQKEISKARTEKIKNIKK